LRDEPVHLSDLQEGRQHIPLRARPRQPQGGASRPQAIRV